MSEAAAEVMGIVQDVKGQSLLDGLRQQRLDTIDNDTLMLVIPGYNGLLKAEYRMLDPKELEKLGRAVVREFKKDKASQVLYGAMDSLLQACTCIHVQNGAGEFVPLHTVTGADSPIVFDVRLADTLKFEPGPTARSILYDTFCQRDMAIVQQNVNLSNWMANPDGSDADALGEA